MYEKDFDKLVPKYKDLLWKFVNSIYIKGMTEDDLFQEMLMVLDFCNKTFDPNKKVRFITYLYMNLRYRKLTLVSENSLRSNEPFRESISTEYSMGSYASYATDSNAYRKDNFWEDFLDSRVDTETPSPHDLYLQNAMIEELEKTRRGRITVDLIINEMTYAEVAKKYEVSHQYVYKANKQNIAMLKEIFT